MRVGNDRDLAGKVSIAGRLHPLLCGDCLPWDHSATTGGGKAPQLSLGSRGRGHATCPPWQGCREGLCPQLVAVARDRQRLLLGPLLLHPCCQMGAGIRDWTGPCGCPHPVSVAGATCPQRGGAAPSGGMTAQDGRQREGTGTKGTDPPHRPLGAPCHGQGEGGRGKESSSAPASAPRAATGAFVMEEDLSKLEKTTTYIKKTPQNKQKKKPQMGKHPPVHIPPPSPCCPSAGKQHGTSGRGRLCLPLPPSPWGQGDNT